jgi:hypothetical protein
MAKDSRTARKHRSRKSRDVPVIALVLLLLGFLFWLSPYWSVAGMARAAQAGDAELLSDYIDMPRVKESLKTQALVAAGAEIRKPKTSGWEAVGIMLGTVMIDRVVDGLVTPQTLAALLSQRLQDLTASRLTITARLIASDKAHWDDDRTFRVYVDERSALTWRREGLTWRLTSVAIPLSKPRKH